MKRRQLRGEIRDSQWGSQEIKQLKTRRLIDSTAGGAGSEKYDAK
jgi:hypothetical protein